MRPQGMASWRRAWSALRSFAALTIAGAVVAGAAGCSPSPRSLPCSNDGECSVEGEAPAFCVDSRCVECVGRGSCGGHPCAEGRCQIPCKDTGACPDDRACSDEGLCVRR